MNAKHIILLLIATAFLAFAGIGCRHTAHGFGKDVEKVGEKIQDKTN